MLLNKLNNRESQLSKFYSEVKEAYTRRRTSRFWFGPLLSAAEEIEPNNINNNLTKVEHCELLNMLSVVACELMSFYVKTPPDEVYKLLHVTRAVFEENPRFESQPPTYHSQMYQVHFNNILALFMIKNKQFTYACECFETIIEIIKNEIVDIRDDIFLVVVSNYLSFVRAHQYSNVSRKIRELLGYLQNIYQGLLDKYLSLGCLESSLLLMLATYCQHEIYFSKNFNAQNNLLIKKFETHQVNMKESLGSHSIHNNEVVRYEHYLAKNKANKMTEIQIKKKELNFFTPLSFTKPCPARRTILSMRESKNIQLEKKQIIQNIISFDKNHMVSSMETKTEEKETIKPKIEAISKTIELGSMKVKDSIDIGNSKLKESKEKNLPPKVESRKKIFNKGEGLILKINYCILEIISDGIILSDFLREKKKFLTWQEVFTIVKNLRFSFVFMKSVPISSFYDVACILSPFITKGEDFPLILDEPKELIELDVLTKLYQDEGPYLKLCAMNQYDVHHVELTIDCYFGEFEFFFKNVSTNQYIEKLNSKAFKKEELDIQIMSLELWKKKRESVAEEIMTQIKSQKLTDISHLNTYKFKIVLLMANNKQILLYLKENKDEIENMEISIKVLDSEEKENKLQVSFCKLQRYFPIEEENSGLWMKRYGKFVIEGYEACFTNYPFSFSNLQFFNVITYAKKMEMMKMGKYYTPVIAELIGCKRRIWGLSIKVYEFSNTKENVTFIFNPYYELLLPILSMSPEERKIWLNDVLLQSSVQLTYKKLASLKMTGQMVNIIDYWNVIDF